MRGGTGGGMRGGMGGGVASLVEAAGACSARNGCAGI